MAALLTSCCWPPSDWQLNVPRQHMQTSLHLLNRLSSALMSATFCKVPEVDVAVLEEKDGKVHRQELLGRQWNERLWSLYVGSVLTCVKYLCKWPTKGFLKIRNCYYIIWLFYCTFSTWPSCSDLQSPDTFERNFEEVWKIVYGTIR